MRLLVCALIIVCLTAPSDLIVAVQFSVQPRSRGWGRLTPCTKSSIYRRQIIRLYIPCIADAFSSIFAITHYF